MSTHTDLTFSLDTALLPELTVAGAAGQLVAGVEVGTDAASTVSDIRFGVEAGVGVEVRVLASPADRDPFGVVGKPVSTGDSTGKSSAEPDSDALGPQLTFDGEHGWLVYGFEAGIQGSLNHSLRSNSLRSNSLRSNSHRSNSLGGKSLRQVGITLDGGRSVHLLDYRRHALDRPLSSAILDDIRAPRSVVRLQDVLRLGQGEALAYGLRGELGLQVRVNVADLISGCAGRIAGLARGGGAVGLRVSSGLTMKASIRCTDDFLVIFSRLDDGRIRLAVKKGRLSSRGLSAAFEARAELEFSESLESTLRDTLDRLIGEPVERIDRLFEASGISELQSDPTRWALFLTVAGRLGFLAEPVIEQTHQLLEIHQAWEAFKKDVDQRIRRLLEAKIQAGFTYDYRRIQESESLLQAVMGPQDLKRHLKSWHGALLKGDLGPVIDVLSRQPDSIERFMRMERLEAFSAWGFSLSLGQKWGLATRSAKHFHRVVRSDLQGHHQVAFVGDRSYEAKFGGKAVSWRVDFIAEMPKPAVEPAPYEPNAEEFELGLAISWRRQEGRASRQELAVLLDQGRLWGCLGSNDVDELLAELWQAVGKSKGRKGFTAEMGFKLDHRAWLEGIGYLIREGDELLPHGLAGALPYWQDFEIRRSADLRSRAYGPLWRQFLGLAPVERRNISRRQLGQTVATALRRVEGAASLASRERALATRNHLTFAAQAKSHPFISEDWADFQAALARLARAYDSDPSRGPESGSSSARFPVDDLQQIFNGLQKLWDQALYVRALGAMLVQCLPLDRLGAYFWIEIEGEAERRIYLSPPAA